ncbi:MAG: hypothetical protein U1D66_06655 [Erythrobacter sp.]|nr:hypothetical protein [Erythrobacter sp.]
MKSFVFQSNFNGLIWDLLWVCRSLGATADPATGVIDLLIYSYEDFVFWQVFESNVGIYGFSSQGDSDPTIR